jgi:hypothetical protein
MTLDELERLAREAIPGPWGADDADNPHMITAGKHARGAFRYVTPEADCPDGAYIVAANPAAVLELIARVRELEAECQRLRERLAEIAVLGTDVPAAMHGSEAGFYRGQLGRAIGTAARALAPSPSAEPPANKESPRCGAEGWHGGRRYRCEIAPGHTPPHVAPTQGGMISWEGAPAAESDKEEFDAE